MVPPEASFRPGGRGYGCRFEVYPTLISFPFVLSSVRPSVRPYVQQKFLLATLQIAGQDVPCSNLQLLSDCRPSSIRNFLTGNFRYRTKDGEAAQCTQCIVYTRTLSSTCSVFVLHQKMLLADWGIRICNEFQADVPAVTSRSGW